MLEREISDKNLQFVHNITRTLEEGNMNILVIRDIPKIGEQGDADIVNMGNEIFQLFISLHNDFIYSIYSLSTALAYITEHGVSFRRFYKAYIYTQSAQRPVLTLLFGGIDLPEQGEELLVYLDLIESDSV